MANRTRPHRNVRLRPQRSPSLPASSSRRGERDVVRGEHPGERGGRGLVERLGDPRQGDRDDRDVHRHEEHRDRRDEQRVPRPGGDAAVADRRCAVDHLRHDRASSTARPMFNPRRHASERPERASAPADGLASLCPFCGCSSAVEPQPSKLMTRVRFPSPAPMTRCNRVDPWGDLHADPARGLFTGNRGCLVDDERRLVRHHHSSTLWITCVLQFRDWRHPLDQPHLWTPLFFLDDAVALAAGHRPCAFCRRADYSAYRDAVSGDGSKLKAIELDRRLAVGAVAPRTWTVPCCRPAVVDGRRSTGLPTGTVVIQDTGPHLLGDDHVAAVHVRRLGPSDRAATGHQRRGAHPADVGRRAARWLRADVAPVCCVSARPVNGRRGTPARACAATRSARRSRRDACGAADQPRAECTGRSLVVKATPWPCPMVITVGRDCARARCSTTTSSPPVKSMPGRSSPMTTCSGKTRSPYRSWCSAFQSPGSVAQQQRRRAGLPGGVAAIEPLVEVVGPRRRAPEACRPLAGDGQQVRPALVAQPVDEVGQGSRRSSGSGPRRSGAGPCRSSSGTGRRRRTSPPGPRSRGRRRAGRRRPRRPRRGRRPRSTR